MPKKQAAGQANVARLEVSTKRLDRTLNPPAMVDEELPTASRDLLVLKRGRVRAPRGTITGSLRLTGSVYSFAPGTFSFRATRVSLATGSRNMAWAIRHSRTGTKDVQQFFTPGQINLLGGPLDPVYAFGPGTILWGWLGDAGGAMGSAYDLSQHIEGFLGFYRPGG